MESGKVEIRSSVGTKKDVHEGSDSHPIVAQETLEPKEIVSKKPSQVSVALGLTKSLGNYEFARVDVTVTESCEPEKKKEKFEELYKIASDYVAKVNSDITKNRKV